MYYVSVIEVVDKKITNGAVVMRQAKNGSIRRYKQNTPKISTKNRAKILKKIQEACIACTNQGKSCDDVLKRPKGVFRSNNCK